MKALIFLFFLFCTLQSIWGHVSFQPEQVHIAYGENIYEIVVTWSTKNDTGESIVEYGINGFAMKANGYSTKFIDGGDKKESQYIHRVTLPGLTPDSRYGLQNFYKIMFCLIKKIEYFIRFWLTIVRFLHIFYHVYDPLMV